MKRLFHKQCFLILYQKFQGSGKKIDNCDCLHTPATPEGGWDKCGINFHTLETSDTILKKTVYCVNSNTVRRVAHVHFYLD